ncbi:MAG: 4-hydroxy-3-methylbut-2-enyl diphosphate reductase [Romboutsia sp.]
MDVKIAKNAGFCFGVKRAMKMAWNELESSNDGIYALGPLIHNKQAVSKYEENGLKTIEEVYDVPLGKSMIIRSHGVGKEIYSKSLDRGINIIDTTCPFVKKIHTIVKDAYDNGSNIIVIGDVSHPEVIGINGWCENSANVIKSVDEVNSINLDSSKTYCVVSQTTINLDMYEKIVNELSKLVKNITFNNTICSSTKVRQQAARDLAEGVDCVIVIGGKHSSNTQKLVNICKDLVPTFAIETKDELNAQSFKKYKTIGVTAGASTPDWIIEDVINFINAI